MRRIRLSEGGGGEEAWSLIRNPFLKHFNNPILSSLEDSALIEAGSRLDFTTDAFTVEPLFFRGGDIGKLAIIRGMRNSKKSRCKPINKKKR